MSADDAEKLAARLEALLTKATKGAWHHVPICRDGEVIEDRIVVRHSRGPATIIVSDVAIEEDAELIAVAKNALPDLIAMLRAQVAELAQVTAERDALREALEQIELLSTNHGGWFETDPWKWGQMMGTTARSALTKGEAK